ncbi:MAG TPA: A/G-specific adenine glycosylase [Anaerolineales bacterium]|nr:A/G-specific adenine glycosylase [Anaerolineales bacterium]
MNRLASKLLAWYRTHKRTPPWRDHPDPYAVWVSEIMLQQTRVETVIPYFEKWLRLFPNVQSLANVSERDVLNAWEGLGYYSRARNLHKAAKIVTEQHNGELPRDLDELRKLPGIGRYTLGAIASIAFGMDVSALDGNIKRVYARIFDVTQPVDSPAGEKILWQLADENLPKGHAGDYNQALMDLGATICVPKNPRCLICPVMELCQAQQKGVQGQRPVKTPKKDVPHYVHAAGVIVERGKVLLAQRTSQGLLGGMWEFPNGRVDGDPARELPKALKTGYNLRLRVTELRAERSEPRGERRRPRHPPAPTRDLLGKSGGVRPGQVSAHKQESLGIVQHGYSHFSVTTYVFRCELLAPPKASNLKWVRLKDLDTYPMGKIDRQIAEMIAKK